MAKGANDNTTRGRHFASAAPASPKPKHGVGHAVLVALWAVLLGVAAFTFRLVDWVFLNWGNLRMDELIYTMTADLSGTNPETIRSGLAHTIPFVVAAIAIAVLASILLHRSRKALKVFRAVTAIASVLVIGGSAFYFFNKIGLGEYVENQSTVSTFIEEHYADPDEVQITFPEQRRNLIFLFVESMEMSFSDAEHGGGKPANVIPELTELGLENETFAGDSGVLNGGYALYGATYTMGGLFAQTSGLPLKVRASTLSVTEGFIPGIATLGEVLQDAGYHNYFLLGTDAAFGDRDKYFVDHGDFTLWDFEYSVAQGEIPADYARGWWGYDDAILYENAKAHLLELAEAGEPFNLTMLTVDTHAEDGYICSLCEDDFPGDRYSNAFACANRQAYDFVRWCQEQDFYENTTIVVVGDHCTMDHDYADDIAEGFERRIYTTYINPAVSCQGTGARQYSSMDNFPTVLAALGATIEGDRLGLGTNLFSTTPTLTEEMGRDELNAQLAKKTAFFDSALGEEANRDVQVTYNDKTGCIDVAVLGDINEDWNYDFVYGTTTQAETGEFVQFALQEQDGVYRASVPMDLFDFEDGTYTCEVWLMMADGLPKWFNTQDVEISWTNIGIGHRIGNESRTAQDITLDMTRITGVGDFSAQVVDGDDGPVIEVTYTPADGASYESLALPTWSWSNGQDDIVWYGSERQEDGSYRTRLNLSQHGTWGIVEFDVYGDNGGEKTLLGTCVMNLS